MRNLQKPMWLLVLAGLGLEALFVGLWKLGDWNSNIPLFLIIFFAAFLLYLVVWKWMQGVSFEAIPHLTAIVIGFAALFRLTVFWCEPSLSEDIYRYILDGRVQIAGINPYRYAPEAPELSPFRDAYYERINHKNFRTPYPPFAETVFHLLAKLPGGLITFKSCFLVFDFLLIGVIYALLKIENLPPYLILVYAWHPLPVLEFAGSGHMDVIAISLFLASYLLLQRKQMSGSGALMAASILTKYVPIISLPWMLSKVGGKFILLLGIVSLAVVAQYYSPDLVLLNGIFAFYQKWWFNDSLFSILYRLLGGAEAARLVGGAVALSGALYCLVKRYSIFRSFIVVYGIILIFSPVVHPWYVCWMIPFLVFHKSLPWLFFSGWVTWAYLIRYLYPIGVWQHVLWLTLLVYVPLFLLLLFAAFQSFRVSFKKI
jgi:alpha-1,6-mannosyltransferase